MDYSTMESTADWIAQHDLHEGARAIAYATEGLALKELRLLDKGQWVDAATIASYDAALTRVVRKRRELAEAIEALTDLLPGEQPRTSWQQTWP